MDPRDSAGDSDPVAELFAIEPPRVAAAWSSAGEHSASDAPATRPQSLRNAAKLAAAVAGKDRNVVAPSDGQRALAVSRRVLVRDVLPRVRRYLRENEAAGPADRTWRWCAEFIERHAQTHRVAASNERAGPPQVVILPAIVAQHFPPQPPDSQDIGDAVAVRVAGASA